MTLRKLLLCSVFPASMLFGSSALAQTVIDADQATPITTSVDGDVTINAGVTAGPADGTAGTVVTIDSSNTVINNGAITVLNADNSIGVDLQSGNSGEFQNTGAIQLIEDFAAEDIDGDGLLDGSFAEGIGRTGILISGSNTFTGNVNQSGSVAVEGNDSFAVRLLEAAVLTGDITNAGAISVLGDNARGISLEGNVTGDVTNTGTINTTGAGASAITSAGVVAGQINNSGFISNTGYRFATRSTLALREALDEDDLLQAGSAIQVNGDVSNGVFLQQLVTTSPVLDADGNPTTDEDGNEVTTTSITRSSVTQSGSAPAVLIDGDGTPIAIGIVASITDPNDENFVEAEQFAFVNQGDLTASGIFDDISATGLEVRDATLQNGINNTGIITVSTFRSGVAVGETSGTAPTTTGAARVIVLGSNAIADSINNSGVILATSSEATDLVFANPENVLSPREVTAIAIDIDSTAQTTELINSNSITALITGRDGSAIALRDASGTLINVQNTGNIQTAGINSDPTGESATNFNLIALDLSSNTTGITLNQSLAVDFDPTDDILPVTPSIAGDILLGSGDDTVSIEAGNVFGDIAFGAGVDSLSLSGGSTYAGVISDPDELSSISVTGGSLLLQSDPIPINVGSATFDETSTFRPTLDGATGLASTLVASGDITFADGASISPVLRNIINSPNTSFTILDAGGNLTTGDLGLISGIETPFLFNSSFAIDPNDANALVITLDLRDQSELGLDAVQAASFGTTIDALQSNSELSNAFTAITDEREFNRAYSQLLPEFSAAARQFVLANVDGAVGAVGTHLDNARRSQERPGGAWIQEFTYFADRDLAGLSEQYRGHGFGFTGGLDSAFGPFHTAGVNFGFASTEIEDVVGVDEPLDIVTLQLGAYAGLDFGNLGLEAYAGGGFNDFESSRRIEVGDFNAEADGDWQGVHYNASLRGGYDIDVGDRFWIRPAFSIDYLSLTEDAYTETGDTGIALDVAKRTSDLGGATAMLNLGAKFQGKRTWIRPALRFGYRNEFINDGVLTDFGFNGLTSRSIIESEIFPKEGFLVGFSIGAGSAYSSFGLDVDSDIRDGLIRHTGRVVLRLIF